MAYSTVSATTGNIIPAADVNQLQSNIEALIESATKSDNYTILDTDVDTFYLSGAGANKTFTLPTLADNIDREITIINNDTTYELNIDGEGAETINGVTDIDIELQRCGLTFKATASGWIILKIIGECEIQTINSAIELVYTKIFIGATGTTGTETVAHGVTDYTKILFVDANLKQVAGSNPSGEELYIHKNIYDIGGNAIFASADAYRLSRNSTNITMDVVGSNFHSSTYTIIFKYYI